MTGTANRCSSGVAQIDVMPAQGGGAPPHAVHDDAGGGHADADDMVGVVHELGRQLFDVVYRDGVLGTQRQFGPVQYRAQQIA